RGKSCVVVLVGSETALRPWVIKEIIKGWNAGKGVFGIRIDKLLDTNSNPSRPGPNPFDMIDCGTGKLSSYVNLITPQGWDSKAVYADIHANMERWIETAIRKRNA
ncbi:TIR domain-containing protein, partial [Pseudomonas aeruginosa]